MAKITIRIKHVAWRDGRPRFVAGPKLRLLGLKGQDLKTPAGAWMSAEQALAWIEEKEHEIKARREAKATGKRLPKPKAPGAYTLSDLFEDLWQSPKFTGGAKAVAIEEATAGRKGKKVRSRKPLAPKTIHDYKLKAASLEAFDPEIAACDIRALTKPILIGLHEQLWDAKGHHMANGIIAVLRLALTYAERKGRVTVNVARDLGLETPEERIRVGSIAEMQVLLRAADAIGEPMVGHAIMLGLMTGQRQTDRLALQDVPGAEEGLRRFRQSKTGAVVEIPETPQLKRRLERAKKEIAAWKVETAHVIVDPATRKPYTTDSYGRAYRRVRAAAVAGVKDEAGREIVKATPSLADFRDQDLRDTAVTWLARAGCTIPQIRAITGHDEQSIYKILKHYLAVDSEMAIEAVGKLVTYLEAKGAAL